MKFDFLNKDLSKQKLTPKFDRTLIDIPFFLQITDFDPLNAVA